MPIKYSLLKGRPVNCQQATAKTKHYQVLVSEYKNLYRVSVNVQSADGSEVQFCIDSHFKHPITEKLIELKEGLQLVNSEPNSIAIDYIRGNLAQPSDFTPLPWSTTGPDNDLNDKLDLYMQQAIKEKAIIYAFGANWGPENKPDAYFGFFPGRGIHDIHMNQGNPTGQFYDDNGPWQDGGLLIHFPIHNQWIALFLKFQTQSWKTDDITGNPT